MVISNSGGDLLVASSSTRHMAKLPERNAQNNGLLGTQHQLGGCGGTWS